MTDQTDLGDLAAWLDQRATERAARYAARQRQRQADRAEFARRRRAGLVQRHARRQAMLRARARPRGSDCSAWRTAAVTAMSNVSDSFPDRESEG